MTMPGTLDVLQQMLDTLNTLEVELENEQSLLCAGRVDAVRLQAATLEKENLLATLRHQEQHRHQTGDQAPYSEHSDLAPLWQTIMDLTQRLHDMNQHNGMLLNQHLTRNQGALDTLKSRHGQSLYGPDGQAQSGMITGRKLSI